MAQFHAYRNPNPESKGRIPLLLDVQSDPVEALHTRVVVPLAQVSGLKVRQITTLMPTFDIDGKKYAMCTPQLAGISAAQIGVEVADLGAHRDAIVAALDLLLIGF